MQQPKRLVYMVYHESANFPSAIFEHWVLAQQYIEHMANRHRQGKLTIHEFELKTSAL